MKKDDTEQRIDDGLDARFRSARCPACDYDLRGQTTNNDCPECGFFLEPEAIWFRPSRWWHRGGPCIALATLGFIALLWITQFLRGFPQWTSFDRVVMTGALIWPLWFLMCRFRYRYRCEFIVVGPSGVHWRLLGNPETCVKWTSVRDISFSSFFQQIALIRKEPHQRISIPRSLWPKSMNTKEFAGLVEQYWKSNKSLEPCG